MNYKPAMADGCLPIFWQADSSYLAGGGEGVAVLDRNFPFFDLTCCLFSDANAKSLYFTKKYGRDNGNVFRRHQRQANRCRSNHSAGGTLFVRASVGTAGKPKGFVHAELLVDARGNDCRQRSALRMAAVTSCASRRTQRIDDEGPEL